MIGVANPVAPGAPFDAFAEAFDPGLVGQISVSIYDQNNNLISGPQTTGIVEIAAIGSLARYGVTLYAPGAADTYLVVWDDNEPDPNSASEELLVSNSVVPTTGPGWITGADVAECCAGANAGSDTSVFDSAAAAANDVLFILSGRQFPGLQGPVKVRPPSSCGCWSGPIWTTGGGAAWIDNGWWWNGRRLGRCNGLSAVTLSGYPVREIIAVKIDGSFLTSNEYRLDQAKDLVRMRDVTQPNRKLCWPGCQILDLPDTESGTWSVSYTWGADPPWQAIDAAKELACEIYKACNDDDTCQLPSGVTKVVRQGVEFQRSILASALASGAVGLPMCDLFLGTYNPDKLPRRSAIYSPDVPRYPYRPGG